MVAGLGNVQLRNQHLALLWQREVFITSFMTNKDFKNIQFGDSIYDIASNVMLYTVLI